MAYRQAALKTAHRRPLETPVAWRLATARLLALLLLAAQISFAAANEFEITLDARQAPRGLLHASLVFPVEPGPFTLLYPKWIPGEHGPTGPVRDLVDLRMEAGGRQLDWQRDPRDLHVFRTTIPAGAKALNVQLNFLLPTEQRGFSAGRSSTDQLAILSWHYVMLYPAGRPVAQFTVRPKLILPEGWQLGTALRQDGAAEAGAIRFRPVALPTLIDSPVLTGRHFRRHPLTRKPVPFELHIAADRDLALESSNETRELYTRIVEEELALFGSHPFDRYDFLMALSDNIALFGLEHHESSDNRLVERMLMSDGGRRGAVGMLAHELVHSWNGKARRPADMILDDYQQPQSTELLWVYEGLTDYLESLLPVRAGLWSEQDWRDHLALTAAELSVQSGRSWRSLADVSISAQLQFDAPRSGANRRREIDFYGEGDLLWLEVDVTIRQLTQGQRSLDDFCREFFGQPARNLRTPKVSGYRYPELLAALNAVARHDWEEFFRTRVFRTNRAAPLGGIEKAGWRLEFQADFPPRLRAYEETSGDSEFRHSLGLLLHRQGEDGKFQVLDVVVDSPADRAGISAGMSILTVNGEVFTADKLRQAMAAAQQSRRAIELRVEHDGDARTRNVDYHGGERYPYLVRDGNKPDLLAEIARSLRGR